MIRSVMLTAAAELGQRAAEGVRERRESPRRYPKAFRESQAVREALNA